MHFSLLHVSFFFYRLFHILLKTYKREVRQRASKRKKNEEMHYFSSFTFIHLALFIFLISIAHRLLLFIMF